VVDVEPGSDAAYLYPVARRGFDVALRLLTKISGSRAELVGIGPRGASGDEWYDLLGEALDPIEIVLKVVALQADHDVLDTGRAEGACSRGNGLRGAGERHPLFIATLLRRPQPVARREYGDIQGQGIAPRGLRMPADVGKRSGKGCRRIKRLPGIADSRIPAIAEAPGATPCCCALAADPNRWMRLLHRLRLEQDVPNADEVAFVRGRGLRPECSEASMYSSDAAPRLAYGGDPSAAISSSIQPTPMPTLSRPLESTSAVASILAARMTGRCGTTITDVSKRIRCVTAAAYVRHVICSKQKPVLTPGQSPLSL